jgi:hypothetical protein
MKSSMLLLAAAATASALCPAAIADSENLKPYELKNRSVFHADMDARIPFWPIGWKRPGQKADGVTEAPVTTSKVQLEPGHFSVSSVLLGHPALAMINGRSFGEGEVLPVIYGNERLKVIVRSIRDGGVTLEHEGKLIFVPLKRPELTSKAAQPSPEQTEFAIKIGQPPAAQK